MYMKNIKSQLTQLFNNKVDDYVDSLGYSQFKKTITLKATIDKINEDDAKNKSLIIINEYSQIYKSSDQGENSVFANDLLLCEKFGNQIQ